MHPRSKHWHQLDLILVRKQHLNNVLLTSSYLSADCDSDHSLVGCKMRISLRRHHKSKKPRLARLDTSKMCFPEKIKQFSDLIRCFKPNAEDEASLTWNALRDSMYSSALQTFGKRSYKSSDWFDDNAQVLLPLVESKRQALLQYNNHPSTINLGNLRAARKVVRQATRK